MDKRLFLRVCVCMTTRPWNSESLINAAKTMGPKINSGQTGELPSIRFTSFPGSLTFLLMFVLSVQLLTLLQYEVTIRDNSKIRLNLGGIRL